MDFRTRAIHEGVYVDKTYSSVTTPIYPSSTFYFDELGKFPQFDYSRSGNPTRSALEKNLAAMEGGTFAAINCTGMAAISTVMFLFKPGDHIVAGHDIYGGTYRLFYTVFQQMGIEFSFVNMSNNDEVRAAIRPNTKCLWIETPSNPLLNLTDIAAVVEIAKKAGAITIADNTFLSPYFQRPLDLGVDVVVHSTTKYINGHSDVVGGAIITKTPELAEKIKFYTNALGTPCSPFDAFLVLRGVKTMALRMEAHQQNALALAHYLEAHPKVKKVYYPGLESHPQHALAKRQMTGFGGMLSFDADLKQVNLFDFCKRLNVIRLAESLGGVESLIEQPWTMSHASMPEDARRFAGITEATMRVSVGLEGINDLIEEFKVAFG